MPVSASFKNDDFMRYSIEDIVIVMINTRVKSLESQRMYLGVWRDPKEFLKSEIIL